MQDPTATTEQNDVREDTRDWRATGVLLVVDDEPMVRLVVATVLAGRGFTVLEAENGHEAIQVFREHRSAIKAVLLDMSMPGMSGAETFREMHRINPDVPIMLLSGLNERDSFDRTGAEGPAGFLAKPFKPAALVEKVRQVLEEDG